MVIIIIKNLLRLKNLNFQSLFKKAKSKVFDDSLEEDE